MALVALLAGCASQHNLSKNNNPQNWTVSPGSGTSAKVEVIPIYRPPPRYPPEASSSGEQGCVRVIFDLDSKGRPTHLRALASVPNDVFDRSAIQAISRWRFRIANIKGRSNSPVKGVVQNIQFFIGGIGSHTRSIINWICQQPPPRTVIVQSMPATTGISVSNKENEPWVTMVWMTDPHHKPLINGWVDVKFCVDSKGRAENVAAYKSFPHGLYNHAAVAAVKSWKFSARETFDSHYASTCGLSYRIRIVGQASLARGPTFVNQRPTAIRTDDLSLPNGSHIRHGKVTMRFCIDKDGKISDPRAIKSQPRGMFDQAAIQILNVWSYWPKTVDGKPVRTCNVQESVAFKLGHDQLVWAYPGTS